jgi:outer membrane protein TolC
MFAHIRMRSAGIGGQWTVSIERRANLGRYAPARTLAISAAFFATGCASFSPDGGMDVVKGIVRTELNSDVVALNTVDQVNTTWFEVDRLLKRPLTEAAAVQIALLNNRDLQTAYNALGISEAQKVRATLPPSPRFSASYIAGGGGLEAEAQIIADILALVTLPSRAGIATDRFRQAQFRAAAETLRVATETRRAYVRAVAARELANFLAQGQTSARASAQLAKQLGESGAMNKLDQARNEVFYAELTAQLDTARQRVTSERESLVRWMGLSGSELAFRLPDALPAIPGQPRNVKAVEVEALRRRIDLQIARLELVARAKSYGLTSATRFINLLDVSGISKTAQEPGGPRFQENGGDVEFQVPLFDFGEVQRREAEGTYMEAVNRVTAKAVNVRSEAREAYQLYRSSYDIAARYQRDVLPLRKIISDETLLRYNAMQIDVFALLIETRERIASTLAAIDARRNYWLADANLAAALTGGAVVSSSELAIPTISQAADAAGQN